MKQRLQSFPPDRAHIASCADSKQANHKAWKNVVVSYCTDRPMQEQSMANNVHLECSRVSAGGSDK
jgi:hypothetical protein